MSLTIVNPCQQSINGTQQSLLRSPAQQSFIEEHRSVDLNTSIDITDDTSLTLVSISDADINDIDDNSGNIATRVRAKNEKEYCSQEITTF